MDLIPAQHGYQNALEVTKAMKFAKAELKKVQMAQNAWDAPELVKHKLNKWTHIHFYGILFP